MLGVAYGWQRPFVGASTHLAHNPTELQLKEPQHPSYLKNFHLKRASPVEGQGRQRGG